MARERLVEKVPAIAAPTPTEPAPTAAAPAEVVQDGEMGWPFTGPALPPGDRDGSGTTDLDDVPALIFGRIDRAAYEIA